MRFLIGGTPTGTMRHITAAQYRAHCGMLVSWRDRAHPRRALRLGAPWAMDNFAFTGFREDRFLASLSAYSGLPGCLFCVAPDVVGDAGLTLAKFGQWHDTIKSAGYPIALALQNGQEDKPVPWQDVDAVFVGGDTAFKFTEFVREVTREAKGRGKWVHMGRVNSKRRWTYAQSIGVDSVDGTTFNIAPSNILLALQVVENRQASLWEGVSSP